MTRIHIVPIGPVEHGVLEHVRDTLARRFRAAVEVLGARPIDTAWLDPVRGQYRADAILDTLIDRRDPDGAWTLGIVDRDLFAPDVNFVFGQATVGGCCGVIGLGRLHAFPDRHAPDPLLLRRAAVEAVHEVGHIAGLNHCLDPACVMAFSTTLEDTDRKSDRFCPRCHARVHGREPAPNLVEPPADA